LGGGFWAKAGATFPVAISSANSAATNGQAYRPDTFVIRFLVGR